MDHVGPDLIDFYPVDAFVNTACPRIAIDDAVKYAKPLITPLILMVFIFKGCVITLFAIETLFSRSSYDNSFIKNPSIE